MVYHPFAAVAKDLTPQERDIIINALVSYVSTGEPAIIREFWIEPDNTPLSKRAATQYINLLRKLNAYPELGQPNSGNNEKEC